MNKTENNGLSQMKKLKSSSPRLKNRKPLAQEDSRTALPLTITFLLLKKTPLVVMVFTFLHLFVIHRLDTHP